MISLYIKLVKEWIHFKVLNGNAANMGTDATGNATMSK